MEAINYNSSNYLGFTNVPPLSVMLAIPKTETEPKPKVKVLVEVKSDKQSLDFSKDYVVFLKSELIKFQTKPIKIGDLKKIADSAKSSKTIVESLLNALDKTYLMGDEVKFDEYAGGLFSNMNTAIDLLNQITLLLDSILEISTIRKRLKKEGKSRTFDEFKKEIGLA